MLTPETILQNRYLIQRQLGQGGMGAVYLATDQRFGSSVALKETFFSHESLRKAFEREARLLNNLRHAALPVVIDHFAEGDGQFLVMQFIPGKDLNELLEENKGAPFEVETVLRWGDQLLDALEYLHEHKPPIVHRDIKPHNLKLTPRGEVILLDFGLAKGSVTGMPLVSLSLRGYTPHYAPLEQIQGTGTDPRSDLYALAATLHHLLTGAIPPDALTRATAAVSGQPDPLRPASELNPRVPVPVAAVLYYALAQNPNQRPATATIMRQALREAREGTAASGLVSTLVDQPALETSPLANTPGGFTTMPIPSETEPVRQTTPGFPAWQTMPPPKAQTAVEASASKATGQRWRWSAIGVAILLAGLIVAAGIVWPGMQTMKSPGSDSVSAEKAAAKLPPAEPMSAQPNADTGHKPGPLSFAVASFDVVTLDEQGRIINERKGQGNSYVEELGGNITLTMMEIPGRAFKMGSPVTEDRRISQEGPLHEVTVQTFFLGKFEITQAQWRVVARWPKINRDLNPDPSKFKGDDSPVEGVSWEDAQEFCARLSCRTGRIYRLPSEAEWEYACRAGAATPFHFGLTIAPDTANYDGNKPYGKGPKGAYRERTMPAGNYDVANAFGLYDMHGNVAEWTQDIWHENYTGAPANGGAWEQGGDMQYRVIRGGSWFNNGDECRSASRSSVIKDNSYTRVGFRVAALARK